MAMLCLLLCWALSATTFAQDDSAPLLEVSIEGVSGEAETNVKAFLSLWPLRGEPVTSPSRLRYLLRKGVGEIKRALQPFGYYRAAVKSALTRDGERWLAHYRIDLDAPIPVGSVQLSLAGEARSDPVFAALFENPPLVSGEPLDQRRYGSFKDRLRSLAAERGYYQARWVEHRVQIDLVAYQADIRLHFDSGPRFDVGSVHFSDAPVSESLLRRYMTFGAGEPVMTPTLVDLQTALIDSGYFSQVEVSPRWDEAEGSRVPIDVRLEANRRTQYRTGLGYGTDTGMRGKLGMTRRWVNKRGHQFDTQLLASEVRTDLTAEYGIPGARPQRDRYALRLDLRDEYSDTVDATGRTLGISWHQQGQWQRTLGLEWRWERFRFGEESRVSEFLVPRLNLTYVSVLNRLKIQDGYRVFFEMLGGSDAMLSDTDFIQLRAGAKQVHSLTERWRLLGRLEAGATAAANFDRLPATLRFYAGGDNSVRGYDYQSLSPRDSDGDRVGGAQLLVMSLETDYRVHPQWALGAFVDLGDAFYDDQLDLHTGVGVGVRWFSPVGPVRLDLAMPQDEEADSLRLHFSLGPDL